MFACDHGSPPWLICKRSLGHLAHCTVLAHYTVMMGEDESASHFPETHLTPSVKCDRLTEACGTIEAYAAVCTEHH